MKETKMIMRNIQDLTYVKEESVYGFGPWVLRDIAEGEQTWKIVVNDWMTQFNQIIVERVPNRSVAVQAGSWQGLYPFLLSNMFAKVYTFEPDPVNFFCTTQNCQRENVFKFQSTLSNKPGVVTFEEVTSTGQGRVEQPDPYNIPVLRTVSVPSMTIDQLALPDCGLVMLDVESHEYEVLQGAEQTIRKFKPVVITEKNFRVERNQQTIELMQSYGYHVSLNLANDMVFAAN